MPNWDPQRYAIYADQRSRPFHELVARIDAEGPRHVVDLGCGGGELTATLRRRWPEAEILGLDSSPEMIADAARQAGPRLRFRLADLRDFSPTTPVDVIISNAALQWVDDHRALLPRLVDNLTPGGQLAFQVPGNQNEPSHTLLHELGRRTPYAPYTAGIDRRVMPAAQVYHEDLTDLNCSVDAWETTYLHVLSGPDPVFTWISGTGARPYLQALPDDLRERFVAEYRRALQSAYPPGRDGTVLPFRRIFAVARRPD